MNEETFHRFADLAHSLAVGAATSGKPVQVSRAPPAGPGWVPGALSACGVVPDAPVCMPAGAAVQIFITADSSDAYANVRRRLSELGGNQVSATDMEKLVSNACVPRLYACALHGSVTGWARQHDRRRFLVCIVRSGL